MRRVADGRLFVAFITCSPHLSYTHIPIAMATVPALCCWTAAVSCAGDIEMKLVEVMGEYSSLGDCRGRDQCI